MGRIHNRRRRHVSGGTLTVSDVKIEMSDEASIVAALSGDIALTENGDGTVNITMGTSYPITVDLTPEYGDPATVSRCAVSQSEHGFESVRRSRRDL
jgi:hypothetical protein